LDFEFSYEIWLAALWEYQARHGGQLPDTSLDQATGLTHHENGMDSAKSTPPPMASTATEMSTRNSMSPSTRSTHSSRAGSPVDELEAIANELIKASRVNSQVLKTMPRDVIE
jgi:hypothetical protein